jgi:MGT family glycosyltransferase
MDDCPARAPGHVLLMPFPAHGHVGPVLPVAAELTRRGHRVTFATTPAFGHLVTAAGATPLVYRSVLAGRRLPDVFDPEYLAREPLRSVLEALATIPVIEAGLQDDPPDLVAYDVSTYAAGRVLARKWRRPAVQLFPTFASGDQFLFSRRIGERFASGIAPDHPALTEFFAWAAELLSVHDLAGIGVDELTAPCEEANLVFLPRAFQIENESFDDRHAFVGPCSPAPAPGRWRPSGDAPVALISLGTTSNRHPEFFRHCAAAFDGLPWQAVMTLGAGVSADDVGAVAGNVEMHSWLPHDAVLPYASVFVSQAGMGSVMQALAFGLPQVMVPYLPEQHFIAERAEELNLGRVIGTGNRTSPAIRESVLSVTADDRVRRSLADMRRHIDASGGVTRAADVVECRMGRPSETV